ncbi:hypothetical protein GCM10018952_43580 [Streptosporangium vulgare]
MSVTGILARGRAAALQLMRDTCTVERKDGAPVLDEATGELVPGVGNRLHGSVPSQTPILA